MILTKNLPRILETAKASERVLDVGGWFQPLNLATHVLDIGSYATRRHEHALDPQNAERYSEDTWTVHDACKGDLPFEDKYFDFCFCSHLLEDVRDPLPVCAEMVRVSKAGYIEMPSRDREIFCKVRFAWLKKAFGTMPEIGFYHHRWFCEIEGSHVRFTVKDQRLVLDREAYITRGELGRKLTEDESGVGLFWEGGFTSEEVFEENENFLRKYKSEALTRLKGK